MEGNTQNISEILRKIIVGDFGCENRNIKILLDNNKNVVLSKKQVEFYLLSIEDYIKSRLDNSNIEQNDIDIFNSIKEVTIPKIIEYGICTKNEMSKLDKIIPTFEQIYKENTDRKMKIEILISAMKFVKNNIGERLERLYMETEEQEILEAITMLQDGSDRIINMMKKGVFDENTINKVKNVSEIIHNTAGGVKVELVNELLDELGVLLSSVKFAKNNIIERLEKIGTETEEQEILEKAKELLQVGPNGIIKIMETGVYNESSIDKIRNIYKIIYNITKEIKGDLKEIDEKSEKYRRKVNKLEKQYQDFKEKYQKIKDELIWYSATRGILPEEERDEVIRVLKDRKKVPISELTKLYVFGFLTPYELIHQMEMMGKTQNQIKNFLKKNPEIQVELSDLELLICLKSKLIENDYLLQRFKSPEDIMRLLSLNFQYTSETKEETSFAGLKNEEIIEILKKLPKQLMPSSDLLYKFYRNLEDIQNENGTQLYFTGKEMLQFAEAGLLEDTRLIDIYEKEKSQIPLKSYIDYFSIEKILTILENPEYCEKLVTMLKDIKSKQITEYGVEKTESEIEKWIMQYVSQHRRKGDDKSEISKTLTTLCEKGILDLKEIIKYNIENGDLLDLYSKGKAKLSEICSNLTSDDLTNLYYDNQATLQEITELFSNGLIKREIYYGILSDNDISDAIITGDIKAVNILEAYMNNNLKLKDVKTIFNKENDILNEYLTDAIVDISIPEDKEQKGQYIGKIEELYLNGVIGYDMLARMRDDEKIEEKVFKEILSKYEIAKAIEEIRKRYGDVIENVEDVYPPNPDPNPGPNPEPRPDPKPNRTPIYMQYIMELSQNSARPIRIVKGNLNGYKFILLENMQVVILEKERDNNATYVLPVVKALEMAQDNTRTELRGTTDVKAVNHTANWAGNLNTAIQKVQERTILEGQPNVTYIKELTGERKNRIAELGKAIREYYIGQKNIGE